MKRRRLLQSLSLAGLSTISYPLLGCHEKADKSKSAVDVSQTKKLGVALVGLGGYSRGQLAPALQLTQHCELRGIVTGSPEKVPTWQEKYNIPDANVYNYEDMHTIANNDDIDVIYIVVPTGLHARYSIIAADAGKHVWCEKPMAINVAECQSIIDACNKNRVQLSIGYRVLHEPNTQAFYQRAHQQPQDALQGIIAEAGYGGSDPGDGWRGQKAMGGGAMYDMGVYTVNGALGAVNAQPIRILEAAHPRMAKEVDLTTTYKLELSNGLIVDGKTSVVESTNRLRLDYGDQWCEMSPMQSYNGVQGACSDGSKFDQHCPNQQAIQMDDDALVIANGGQTIAPGEMGMRDVAVINAIFESAASGKAVDINI